MKLKDEDLVFAALAVGVLWPVIVAVAKRVGLVIGVVLVSAMICAVW